MKLSDLKILICDDSKLARRQTKAICAELGCTQIFEADDGVSSIKNFEENKPDIVLLDIIMPHKDGIEVLREIKAIDPSAHIIMVSSVGTQENLKTAIKEGAYDFLLKPIEQEKLKAVLDSILEGGR